MGRQWFPGGCLGAALVASLPSVGEERGGSERLFVTDVNPGTLGR